MLKRTVLFVLLTPILSVGVNAEEKYYETIDDVLQAAKPLVAYANDYIPIIEDGLSELTVLNRYLEEWAFCNMVYMHIQDLTEGAYEKASYDNLESLKEEKVRIDKQVKEHMRAIMYMGIKFSPDKKHLKNKIEKASINVLPDIMEYDLYGQKAKKEKRRHGAPVLTAVERKCNRNFGYYSITWAYESDEVTKFQEVLEKLKGKKIIIRDKEVVIDDK